eukprot:UN00373
MEYTFDILWNVATSSYLAVVILPFVSADMQIFFVNTKNGMYSPISYCLAIAIAQIPFIVMLTLFTVTPFSGLVI